MLKRGCRPEDILHRILGSNGVGTITTYGVTIDHLNRQSAIRHAVLHVSLVILDASGMRSKKQEVKDIFTCWDIAEDEYMRGMQNVTQLDCSFLEICAPGCPQHGHNVRFLSRKRY